MKAEDITYRTLNEGLFKAVPELSVYNDAAMKGYAEDGPHVMYGMLMSKALPVLFSKNQDDVLKRLFAFLETLANHPDSDVQGVIGLTVCQEIVANEVVLQKAQRLMGTRTRHYCDDLLKGKS